MKNACALPKQFWDQVLSEQSIIGARASVMVYDDNQKKWVPSGSSSGLSKVQIYHHQQNNTFRVVGRKLQDHEVVINCSILKGLKYNQATATFHQWRDSKYVYGLNFSSQHDAEAFARAMMHALEVLSGRVNNQPGQPCNGNGYEEDMGYRTMTSEDAAILRQQQQLTGHVTPSAQTPTSQTNQNNIPQSPPNAQGHHRTSRNSYSAPPAPQPPQMTVAQQQQQQQQQIYNQGTNVQNHNGLQAQVNVSSVQSQYLAPQQMQHQPQVQQQHIVYASQQLIASGFPQQNQPAATSQQMSTTTQQPQQNNGPIYVTSQPQLSQSIPSSSSVNNVVYASNQQIALNNIAHQPQHLSLTNGLQASNVHGLMSTATSQQQPQQAQNLENVYGQPLTSGPVMHANIPTPPPLNRMSSTNSSVGVSNNSNVVPVAPPPPPNFSGYNAPTLASAPPQAPIPPAPPAINSSSANAPPPPPPPPTLGALSKKDDPQVDLMGSLAAQLQQAKLKKNKAAVAATESNGSTSSSSGGSSNYGTIGRSSCGMASMMDEMAKTLARRRAQAEKKEPEPDPEVKQRPWEKSNTLPHKLGSSNTTNANSSTNATNNSGDSPRPMRKRFGSSSEETILKVNGDALSIAMSCNDLDALKAEIVREMRAEIQKVKQDIIEAIKSEFNRR